MKHKRGQLIRFLGVFVLLILSARAQAQFLGNPVALSGKRNLALGVSGAYQDFKWEAVSFRSQGVLGRFSFGLAEALDICLLGGYRNWQFQEQALNLSDVDFGFSATGCAGLRVWVFGNRKSRMALHGFAEGLYFNPQTYFEKPASGQPAGTVQRSYVYLTGYTRQAGIVGIFRLSHFDFFAGLAVSSFHFQTERDDYRLSAGSVRLADKNTSIQETPVEKRFSVGFDLKLPHGYRIGLEAQSSTTPDFQVLLGVSQIARFPN